MTSLNINNIYLPNLNASSLIVCKVFTDVINSNDFDKFKFKISVVESNQELTVFSTVSFTSDVCPSVQDGLYIELNKLI